MVRNNIKAWLCLSLCVICLNNLWAQKDFNPTKNKYDRNKNKRGDTVITDRKTGEQKNSYDAIPHENVDSIHQNVYLLHNEQLARANAYDSGYRAAVENNKKNLSLFPDVSILDSSYVQMQEHKLDSLYKLVTEQKELAELMNLMVDTLSKLVGENDFLKIFLDPNSTSDEAQSDGDLGTLFKIMSPTYFTDQVGVVLDKVDKFIVKADSIKDKVNDIFRWVEISDFNYNLKFFPTLRDAIFFEESEFIAQSNLNKNDLKKTMDQIVLQRERILSEERFHGYDISLRISVKGYSDPKPVTKFDTKQKICRKLSELPYNKVDCESLSGEEFNAILSQFRADAAYKFLTDIFGSQFRIDFVKETKGVGDILPPGVNPSMHNKRRTAIICTSLILYKKLG